MKEKPDTQGEPDPSPTEANGPGASQSLEALEAATKRLGEKIAEAKRRHDLPVDSTLGDPNWDERAKDGRFDRKDDDED